MSNEKLCEYLTDIGILLFDNIELFFKIHSIKSEKHFKNEPEKLKDSLFQYLQKTSKNDNLLRLMSKQLIESYYNSQAVSQYKALKNMINIFQNKLFLIYNSFFIKLAIYLMNKNVKISNNEYKNRKKRTTSDDNIFRNNQENSSVTVIPKSAKTKSKPKKRVQRPTRTNKYKNNYYMNIQQSNTFPYGYFVNNNNDDLINVYRNDYRNTDKEITSISNDNYDRNIYDENIVSYKYYSPMVNIQSKKPLTNNYMPINNFNNNYDNQLLMNNNDNNNYFNYYNINNNQNYINNINSNIIENSPKMEEINYQTQKQFYNNSMYVDTPDDYDFFDNEQKHIQKVQNKIMNLKNERITKLEEQCTFTPEINRTYKLPKNDKYKNIFDKLYDYSTNKLNRTNTKKKIVNRPKLEKKGKNQLSLSFIKRLQNSIDNKQKYIDDKLKEQNQKIKEASCQMQGKVNEKEIVARLYQKEFEKIMNKKKEANILEKKEKKKPVINWKKKFKDYYKKYPEGDDYKKQLEKRKKILNSISNETKNNNVIEFNEFLKEKEENKNNSMNNDNIENNDNNNIENNDNNNIENNHNDNIENNNNVFLNNDNKELNSTNMKTIISSEDIHEN